MDYAINKHIFLLMGNNKYFPEFVPINIVIVNDFIIILTVTNIMSFDIRENKVVRFYFGIFGRFSH